MSNGPGHNSRRLRNRKARLRKQQQGLCFLCGMPMPKEDTTFEHVLPRQRGASRSSGRHVAVSHNACNQKRGCRRLTAVQKQRLETWYGKERAQEMMTLPTETENVDRSAHKNPSNAAPTESPLGST